MSYQGKVLITHPNCPKDNPFYKSVIFIYQDNPRTGTLGVIVNKPSKYKVQDVCAEKNIMYVNPIPHIFHGGPVNPNALILLHTDEWQSDNTIIVHQGLCISSDNVMLENISKGKEPKHWRLFGGISGWSPGQLQQELSGKWPYRPENSWLIADIDADFLFKVPFKSQWNEACALAGNQMFDQYF